MNRTTLRARLLGGAVLGVGLSALVPQQAMAACVVGATSVVCGNTTTTDTLYPANTPNDRAYSSLLNLDTGSVTAGALVDGFGLYAGVGSPAGGTFTFTNDGVIQMNLGNASAFVPGSGALVLAAINSPTNVIYQGAGDILNLGTGNGMGVVLQGTGFFTATIGGSVRADAGDGINVSATNPNGGAITLVTNSVNASGGDGIDVTTAGSGDVTITSNNGIQDSVGVGDLQNGIIVNSTGTGNITIDHNAGAIGNTVDRAQLVGISATINNAASTGTIDIGTLAGTGINTVGDGINATTNGTGNIIVNNAAAINTTAGDGIDVTRTGGAGTITVTNTGVVGNVGQRTNIGINAVNANGAVTVTNTGGQTWADNFGIYAEATNGSVLVNSGVIDSLVNGLNAVTNNGTSCGNVTVNVTGNIAATNSGVYTQSCGSGQVTVNAGTSVTSTGGWGLALNSVTGTNVFVDGTVNDGTVGAVVFENGAGALTIRTGGIVNGKVVGNALAQTVTVNTGGIWNATGVSDLGAGVDSTTNNGTLNLAAGSSIDFGADADTLTNNVGGIINVNGNSSFLNLETFTQNGRINLNTFTLTGPAIAFVNNGTIDTNGICWPLGLHVLQQRRDAGSCGGRVHRSGGRVHQLGSDLRR